MAITGKGYVIYLKTVKCRFPPRITIAVPCNRQAGINSPRVRVDERVIYTSEGRIVEAQLEKMLLGLCVKCRSLQSDSSLWKCFFESPY